MLYTTQKLLLNGTFINYYNASIKMNKIFSDNSETVNVSVETIYCTPQIEIIEIELEGVIAASDFKASSLEDAGLAW